MVDEHTLKVLKVMIFMLLGAGGFIGMMIMFPLPTFIGTLILSGLFVTYLVANQIVMDGY